MVDDTGTPLGSLRFHGFLLDQPGRTANSTEDRARCGAEGMSAACVEATGLGLGYLGYLG